MAPDISVAAFTGAVIIGMGGVTFAVTGTVTLAVVVELKAMDPLHGPSGKLDTGLTVAVIVAGVTPVVTGLNFPLGPANASPQSGEAVAVNGIAVPSEDAMENVWLGAEDPCA